MKKAIYVTPIIEIHRIEPPVIMAGSDPNSISIGVDDSTDFIDGTFRSKQNKKGLWDEDE